MPRNHDNAAQLIADAYMLRRIQGELETMIRRARAENPPDPEDIWADGLAAMRRLRHKNGHRGRRDRCRADNGLRSVREILCAMLRKP